MHAYTSTHASMHTCTHACMHKHTQNMDAHTCTSVYTGSHACTHKHVYKHTQACARARARTHPMEAPVPLPAGLLLSKDQGWLLAEMLGLAAPRGEWGTEGPALCSHGRGEWPQAGPRRARTRVALGTVSRHLRAEGRAEPNHTRFQH